MVTVEVTHDKKLGAYELHYRYGRNEFDIITQINTVLKVMIPVSDRMYDPITKIWTIAETHWHWYKTLVTNMRVSIDLKTKVDAENFHYAQAPAAPTKQSIAAQLAKLLGITEAELATAELKKIYRRKALELHPDRNNGDGSCNE